VRHAGDDAQRVARGTVSRYGDGVGEAEGTPEELYRRVSVCARRSDSDLGKDG
jgi:hypothetical protein